MTLGEYGVAATVGKGFDFLYLLVNGFVGNAADFAELAVALIFIGMFAAVVAAAVAIVRGGIGGAAGALNDLGQMGRI